MKNQNKYKLADDLLRRYLLGELSKDESTNLEKILDSDPASRKYLEQMEQIWKLSSSMGAIESIDKEGDWNIIREKLQTSRRPQKQTRSLVFRIARVAAIFILACFAGYMVYQFTGPGLGNSVEWITVTTSGSNEEIILPDGSLVTLNTGSTLIYPADFEDSSRTVKLNGEAFFEVARDEKKPFLISIADETSVEVLGTSFNIRQDPKNKKVFLNVLSGKVAFYKKGQKEEAEVLEKNEQAVYQGGSINMSASFDLNFLSWKTRSLEFENTPLNEVVEQLSRHYKKEFQITDTRLDSLSLTGTYKNQDIEEVLEEIGLVLDIAFETEAGFIHVLNLE